MDEDFDSGGGEPSGDTGTNDRPPEDSTSETDVRRAVRSQKAAKGISGRDRDEEPIERDPNDRNANYDDVKEALRESNERREHAAAVDAVGTHFQGLAPYAEKAIANGTNLQNAVESWHSAEQAVHRDPPNGLTEVLQQMGYDPRKVIDAAYRAQNDPVTINRNIAAMASDTRNYPHFQALRGTMAQLVQHGYAHTLSQAYRLALAVRANAARGSSPASSRRAARGVH